MRKLIVASLVTLGISVAFLTSAKAAAPVPRPMKELTLMLPSGTNSLLTSYKGKVVMLAFMFTTCPHCQALSQVMTKLQGELGPRGFQALGAAFNDEVNSPDQKANLAVTGNFVSQFHVGFPVGRVPRETVLNYVGVSVIDTRWVVPQIVIIDRKGMIVAQSDPKGEATPNLQREDYLRTYLGGLLGPGTSTTSKDGGKKAPAKAVDKKTS
jgi:thiol-disulfide isomerase/thioredoxin